MSFDLWAFVELAEGYIPERMRKPARGLASLLLLSSALGLSKVIGQLGHWTAERYLALPPWIFPILQGAVLILAGILFGYFLGRSTSKEPKIGNSIRGPNITHDGVMWETALGITESGGERVFLSDPLCPACNSPLQFHGEWKGHCPNEKCAKKYSLTMPLKTISERARLDAIGRYRRNEIAFDNKSKASKSGTYVGEKFMYEDVEWTPVLVYVDGEAGDSLSVSGPLCPVCSAPLFQDQPVEKSFADCPTCKSRYRFSEILYDVKQKVKLHAIGLSSRKKLVFPSFPKS